MSVSTIITGLQMLQAVEQMLAMAKEVNKMNLETEQRNQMLKDYMNEKGVVALIANDFPATELKQKMEAKGLPCVSARTIDGNNVGETMCWVCQQDIEMAKMCLDEISGERMKFGSSRIGAAEISLASVSKLGTAEGKNAVIKNLSEEEMTALLPELTAKCLNFGKHENKNGNYTVYVEVDRKDGDKFNAIKEAVKQSKIVMLNPNYVKNRMLYQKDEKIAMNRFEKAGYDTFFVVDRQNPSHIISVKDNQFKNLFFDKENNKEYIEKNITANENLSLRAEYKYAVSQMEDPVVISDEKVNTTKDAYHQAIHMTKAPQNQNDKIYNYIKANFDKDFEKKDMEQDCNERISDTLWTQMKSSMDEIKNMDIQIDLESIPRNIIKKNIDDYIADALESKTFLGQEVERQEITVEL